MSCRMVGAVVVCCLWSAFLQPTWPGAMRAEETSRSSSASPPERAGVGRDALAKLAALVDAAGGRAPEQVADALCTQAARQLATKPAPERYELLREWVLPGKDHTNLRRVECFAPAERAPEVFFEPANRTGPAAGTPMGSTVLCDDGVISFTEMLVNAAGQSGRLDELGSAVQQAVDKGLRGADTLFVLVQSARGQGEDMRAQIEAVLVEQRKKLAAEGEGGATIPWSRYLIARAWMRQAATRDLGERLMELLVAECRRTRNTRFLTQVLHDLHTARAKHCLRDPRKAAALVTSALPEAPVGLPAGAGLELWQTAGDTLPPMARGGGVSARWAEWQGTVAHVPGFDNNWLYFNYPLAGEFEFSVDTLDWPWGEGMVGYGGLCCEPLQFGVGMGMWTIDGVDRLELRSPFQVQFRYNRLAIEVRPDRVRYLCNGRLFFEDEEPTEASPWIALYARGSTSTAWRHFQITGKPSIPREVRLVDGKWLAGWNSRFYGESAPPRLSGPGTARRSTPGRFHATAAKDCDWSLDAGVMRGRYLKMPDTRQAVPSWLVYHRPLRSGETVTYEFFCQPGKTMVHPSLGRIAFLVEPGGVRLRWIGEEPMGVATGGMGMAPVVQTVEPTERPDLQVVEIGSEQRGPKLLPLQRDQWNRLVLALGDDAVRLRLNDVEIYERRLTRAENRQFGLYHYKNRTAAEVRNVVLRGNWPPGLSAGQLTSLTARDTSDEPASVRRARAALVDEQFMAVDADSIVFKARSLGPAQRFAYLRAWVLPEDTPAAVRLYGSSAPQDPAPCVAQQEAGGSLRSPALELIAAAKQCGKLDELTRQVEAISPENEYGRKARLAMLMLLQVAAGRDEDAIHTLRQMQPLVAKMPLGAPVWQRWPELAAGWVGAERPKLRPAAKDLLAAVVDQANEIYYQGVQIWEYNTWERYARHAHARASVGLFPGNETSQYGVDPRLEFWSPVVHATAASRGQGWPVAQWALLDETVCHFPGHHHDYLYFSVPLRGDFSVECELGARNWHDMFLSYGGRSIHWNPNLNQYGIWQYGHYVREGSINPPLDKVGEWYAYRLTVQGQRMEVAINGRRVFQEDFPEGCDPWLAIRSLGNFTSSLRNLRITGSPVVPERIELSQRKDTLGWLNDYYEESITGNKPDWRKVDDALVGRRRDATPGLWDESLLRYHRPLLEDGQIEYEFFYEADKVMAHPALDRLVFLLEPQGIRIHWLTDGKYDRTGLKPDNTCDEPANRRGEGPLPLKAGQWNRLRLSLKGQRVSIVVNDALVYERDIEPSNQRTFGLFHFADQTEARVRHVTYHGQWAQEAPRGDALLRKKQ